MKNRLKLYVLVLIVAASGLAIAGCGDDDGGGGGGSGEQVSGNLSISGVWTGQEARSFNAVLDGFKQEQPNVTVKYRPVGDEIPTVLSTAVQGGNPPDLAAVPQPGLVRDFARPERAEADRRREEHDRGELLRGRGRRGHRGRQALRAAVQGGQQVDRLVQRPALRAGGRRAGGGLRRVPQERRDAQGIGHEGILARRCGRLDADGPVREHLPASGRSGEVRPARRRTRSRGPTSP